MSQLDQRRFGRTERLVSCLGIGTYHLISDQGVLRNEAVAVLRRAMVLGVNLVDTAPLYGGGEAEDIVGYALREYIGKYTLINKIGRFEGSGFRRRQEAAYLDTALMYTQFERSLRLLRRDTVELLLMHESDWPQWWGGEDESSAPGVDFLKKLRRDGLAHHVGLSLRDPERAANLCNTGIFDAMLYVHFYNMIWQENGDIVLPSAQANDMGVAIGAPYRQGLLIEGDESQLRELERKRDRNHPPGILERIRAARALSKEVNIPFAELGLRFLLSDERVHCVVVGPRNVEELEENIEWAAKGPLPSDIFLAVQRLRDIPLGEWS